MRRGMWHWSVLRQNEPGWFSGVRNALASAGQDVSEIVKRWSALFLVKLFCRVMDPRFSRASRRRIFQHQTGFMLSLFCNRLWNLRPTLLRALHGSGPCVPVSPCQRQLSRPSVCFVWPSCHQQNLSCPHLLAFGCHLWGRVKRGLPWVNSPCLCWRELWRHGHHRRGFSLPSSSPENKTKHCMGVD